MQVKLTTAVIQQQQKQCKVRKEFLLYQADRNCEVAFCFHHEGVERLEVSLYVRVPLPANSDGDSNLEYLINKYTLVSNRQDSYYKEHRLVNPPLDCSPINLAAGQRVYAVLNKKITGVQIAVIPIE